MDIEARLSLLEVNDSNLRARVASLESLVSSLTAQNTHFQNEQNRFMRACVCVTLNKNPMALIENP